MCGHALSANEGKERTCESGSRHGRCCRQKVKAAAFPICAAACFRGIRRRFSRGGCIFSSSGFSRLVLDLPLAPLTICMHNRFYRFAGINLEE